MTDAELWQWLDRCVYNLTHGILADTLPTEALRQMVMELLAHRGLTRGN